MYSPNKEDLILLKNTKFPDNKYTPAQLIMKASENKELGVLIQKLWSFEIYLVYDKFYFFINMRVLYLI